MSTDQLHETILTFWKETDAFQESIDSRPASMPYVFFDGPPFTSGEPHYGHLLQSILKDMVPRWMTMRGYRVQRKRGRDCHGIPAENYVNKQLGITSKKQVEEEVGIESYIESCRSMVNNVNEDRQWTVDHIGRRVDMKNAYFTMSREYMESVLGVFADLYHNNYIFKGFKVLGYSRALGTPLSNHEINEGYAMRQDPAVTIKLPLEGKTSPAYEKNPYNKAQYIACGVVRNQDGAILNIFDKKHGTWFIPGGKIEQGESAEEALHREIQEELGVSVTTEKKLGSVTLPHDGEVWELIYFDITVSGEPKNMEPEKHSELAWVSSVEADNELGYGVKVNGLIVDDEERIHGEFKDFVIIHEEKYLLGEDGKTPLSMIAWTTTPWTLPSNMFAAVHNTIQYVVLFDHDEQEVFVLAEECIDSYYKSSDAYTILYWLDGASLVGLNYLPPFEYYYADPAIAEEYKDQVHRVVHADFVNTEAGTGIAHEAPAFGEDDYNLVTTIFPKDQAKDWLFDPVDEHGSFTDQVPEWSGTNVIEANKPIIKALKEKGVIVKHETINHSYPHCPRTKTPLIYKAIESRFVKETELKKKTLQSVEGMNFVPDAVKKRFYNGLESAPDWNISRSRFWGAPLPVWENPDDPEERLVIGSLEELYTYNKPIGQIEKKDDDDGVEYIDKKSGKPVDFHRPYIDEIVLVHPESGHELRRIPEVLDCRFESGSMPYAQDHMNKDQALKTPPVADFIAEGLDQTRGWFRALHVLGHAYIDQPVFKNVVVTGLILAEDGKKMSKSLQNYPDPSHLLKKFGADPLRLYLLSSPVVRGEPLRFEEQGVEQMVKDVIIPLENVWNFFDTYAQVDNREAPEKCVHFMRHGSESINKTIADGLSEDPQSSEHVDQVVETLVNIKPDVLLVVDDEKSLMSADAIQTLLDDMDYPKPDIKRIESLDHALDDDTTYSDLIGGNGGKSVLFVGHQRDFEVLYTLATGGTLGKEAVLAHGQIVPMPLMPLTNELDQWIYAECNMMLDGLSENLEAYDIEPATRTLIAFIDKLTNWYIRRSRRRFREGGMNDDKQSAYATLWIVLRNFLKAAAPFMPFTTEKIWQAMGEKQSIHLAYRPQSSTVWINQTLIDEITTVRKIIKGALYLRAKNEIKVKQPLRSLRFKL